VLPSKRVNKSIQGRILHRIEGTTVSYSTERTEVFTTFELEVKGRDSLDGSFDAVPVSDALPGDNRYRADGDIGLIDASIRHSICHAPEALIFRVRRFDYDLKTAERMKIRSFYRYPQKTGISLCVSDAGQEGCEYKLSGVAVHAGSAMSAHYFSSVRNRNHQVSIINTALRTSPSSGLNEADHVG